MDAKMEDILFIFGQLQARHSWHVEYLNYLRGLQTEEFLNSLKCYSASLTVCLSDSSKVED
jgi:hypothetical protein